MIDPLELEAIERALAEALARASWRKQRLETAAPPARRADLDTLLALLRAPSPTAKGFAMHETFVTPEERRRRLLAAAARERAAAKKHRQRELSVNDIIDRARRENRGQRVFNRIISTAAVSRERR